MELADPSMPVDLKVLIIVHGFIATQTTAGGVTWNLTAERTDCIAQYARVALPSMHGETLRGTHVLRCTARTDSTVQRARIGLRGADGV